MKFDVVVVGSGIAGLSFALKTAKLGHKVAIVTKKERSDTNTNHAQGGIASVTSCADNFESHVKDTLIAGDGLCHEDAVREIVKSGPQQIKDLIEEGVQFTSLQDVSCTSKTTRDAQSKRLCSNASPKTKTSRFSSTTSR